MGVEEGLGGTGVENWTVGLRMEERGDIICLFVSDLRTALCLFPSSRRQVVSSRCES